jgi:hypothetical protein
MPNIITVSARTRLIMLPDLQRTSDCFVAGLRLQQFQRWLDHFCSHDNCGNKDCRSGAGYGIG